MITEALYIDYFNCIGNTAKQCKTSKDSEAGITHAAKLFVRPTSSISWSQIMYAGSHIVSHNQQNLCKTVNIILCQIEIH